MKKAIGYTRISTTDQSNFSLAAQERMLTQFADQQQYELLSVFSDNGASAKNFDRPDWLKLHDFVKQHYHTINVLLLSKYDRFSRNLKEALNNIELFETNYGILIISASEPINLHPKSPYYFKFRTDYLTGAHLERLVIAERTKTGIRMANLQGRYITTAPFGYINSKTPDGKPGLLLINETKAAIIKSMFEMMASGHSLAQVKAFAYANGYANRHKSAVLRTLQNIVYTGKVKVNAFYDEPATTVKGLHQPIVSDLLFNQANDNINPRRLQRHKTSNYFYLRGLLRCNDCERKVTAAFSKGKSHKVGYYFCNLHRSLNINSNRAHDKLLRIFDMLAFSTAVIEQIKDAVKIIFDKYNANRFADLNSKVKELADLHKKQSNLEERFFSGDIEKEVYQKWAATYKAQVYSITQQVALLKQPISQLWQVIEDNLHLLNNITFLFAKATSEDKQQLLRMVFDDGLRYDGEVYRTRYISEMFASQLKPLAASGLLAYEGNQQFEVICEGSTPPISTFEPMLAIIAHLKKIAA